MKFSEKIIIVLQTKTCKEISVFLVFVVILVLYMGLVSGTSCLICLTSGNKESFVCWFLSIIGFLFVYPLIGFLLSVFFDVIKNFIKEYRQKIAELRDIEIKNKTSGLVPEMVITQPEIIITQPQ